MTVQIQNLAQVSINVHNLESAIGFYRDTLGINLQFNTDTMAFFDLNGLTIMLSIPENLEFDHPSSVLYFKVEDIHASYQSLMQKNVKMRGEPHVVYSDEKAEEWMTFFEDNDKNLLALMSHVQK
jgi:extradiol dioxygenase family protein